MLFITMLFLAFLFFSISNKVGVYLECYLQQRYSQHSLFPFSTLPLKKKGLQLEPDPEPLECSACNTSLKCCCSSNSRRKKISNLNRNDASVIKVSDCYYLCRLKTFHLCALQYLTALASVTLIFDCINHTDSSYCIHHVAGPISHHCIHTAPPLIMLHRVSHYCITTQLLRSK